MAIESAINELWTNVNVNNEISKNNNEQLKIFKIDYMRMEEDWADQKSSSDEKIVNIWKSIGFMN